MEELVDLYCKTVAKTETNPFKSGVLYKYSRDLNLVYDAEGFPHPLGTFGNRGPLGSCINQGPLDVHVDYFDSSSSVLAMFVEV